MEQYKPLNTEVPIWLHQRIQQHTPGKGQIKEAAHEAWMAWVAEQESLSRQDDPARAKLIRDMMHHLRFLAAFASIEVLQIASENLAVPVRLAQSSLSQHEEEVQPARRKSA
jgi:hypothetical protein